jgi:mannitol operon transcriptional antiterminator
MVSLTLQQRNMLQHLLSTDAPVATAELAAQLNLTPRQISYRLKPVRNWLAQRDVALESTPGIGVEVKCSLTQRQELIRELTSQNDFQLVLTAEQRQQLLALIILTTGEPLILNWLQHISAVSRTTVLKDLEAVETWGHTFNLALIRKPNYGIVFSGPELARRQALAALLWGDVPWKQPLMSMTHGTGLTFTLTGHTSPPIIQHTDNLLNDCDTQTAFAWVTFAEDQLGGRFTDDAVLHLALALAIQARRVLGGHQLDYHPKQLAWLKAQKVWPVAVDVSRGIWSDRKPGSLTAEIAGIAMHLLAGLRDHIWPGGLDLDPSLTDLVNTLMQEVARAFNTPEIRHDVSLRDGLVAHIIPAIMRQRFGLWAPPSWSDGTLLKEYFREYEIARELAALVTEQTGVVLPDGETDTLTLLIRAAFIRERPSRHWRIFIICPSGMATAQLLGARLKARFPSLEIMGVLSVRELTLERVADAHLLISTVPVQAPRRSLTVIQVHPLLLSEDIEAITNWLAAATRRT